MKRQSLFLKSITMAMAAVMLFVLNAHAQEPFHVRWTMDSTQAGVSDHVNFTPASAILAGGPNAFTLPTVYSSSGGALGMGYVIRPWPTLFSSSRYMEFTCSAGALKYNITSIGFRLRRSFNGPSAIKVRTSMDSFATDLDAFTISNNSVFNTYAIPVSYTNLSNNAFTVRIYAYNSVDIHGTLWFDEISINGDVVDIILPVHLLNFNGKPENRQVTLTWETSWEKDSKEFVIERSRDMRDFEPIGRIAASGQTTGRTSYTFSDPNPPTGNNYYRLKLTDQDGGFTSCKLIAVFVPEPAAGVFVAPNPATPHTITLHVRESHNTFLSLHNESGIPVPFRRENGAGARIFLIPANPLAPGIYFVEYIQNGRKEQLKVLVP